MVVLGVEWLEIFCIIRHQNSPRLVTPLHQLVVTRVFTELVFGLNHVVAALSEKSFEDSPHMFVKQNLRPRHWTVSLGFSDDSRTFLNAASLSASRARISLMCA